MYADCVQLIRQNHCWPFVRANGPLQMRLFIRILA